MVLIFQCVVLSCSDSPKRQRKVFLIRMLKINVYILANFWGEYFVASMWSLKNVVCDSKKMLGQHLIECCYFGAEV